MLHAWLSVARNALEEVHPALPWALLTLGAWLSVLGVRKYLPGAWAVLERVGPEGRPAALVFQALPSVLFGALASAFLTGGDFADMWKGAAAGALAPLFHHVLKSSPFPYTGKTGK